MTQENVVYESLAGFMNALEKYSQDNGLENQKALEENLRWIIDDYVCYDVPFSPLLDDVFKVIPVNFDYTQAMIDAISSSVACYEKKTIVLDAINERMKYHVKNNRDVVTNSEQIIMLSKELCTHAVDDLKRFYKYTSDYKKKLFSVFNTLGTASGNIDNVHDLICNYKEDTYFEYNDQVVTAIYFVATKQAITGINNEPENWHDCDKVNQIKEKISKYLDDRYKKHISGVARQATYNEDLIFDGGGSFTKILNKAIKIMEPFAVKVAVETGKGMTINQFSQRMAAFKNTKCAL